MGYLNKAKEKKPQSPTDFFNDYPADCVEAKSAFSSYKNKWSIWDYLGNERILRMLGFEKRQSDLETVIDAYIEFAKNNFKKGKRDDVTAIASEVLPYNVIDSSP